MEILHKVEIYTGWENYALCIFLQSVNEECPGTFRHLGYYEKINLIASLNVFKVYQLIMNKV